jgi:hypothetical protein
MKPPVRHFQVMGNRSGATLGVYSAQTPLLALDAFAKEMLILRGIVPPETYGWSEHCERTGAPREYRTDDFRIFVF